MRKALELHVKDLQDRLDQAEVNALKGGKRIIQKMEQRVNIFQDTLKLLNFVYKNILLRFMNLKLNLKQNKDIIMIL